MTDMAVKPLTVQEYQDLAEQQLSPMAWDYYNGGAGDELTLRDNREA